MSLNNFVSEIVALGGKVYATGGYVRDVMLGLGSHKDMDLEVHGVTEEVMRFVLSKYARVNLVGQSFGVYKATFDGQEVDISLPRTEKKVGSGHTGFDVTADPFLGTLGASRRRDFTINSMMLDMSSGELVDHFGGRQDLENEMLRMVDPRTFVEDPLRVLRAAQFVSRFGFQLDPELVTLANSMDLATLPKERIREEIFKLLRGSFPALGLQALFTLGIAEKLFPEIYRLKDVPQRAEYHTEGPVDVHTGMVLTRAAEAHDQVTSEEFLVLMLAALCHDFGKAVTTTPDGRAPGHESAGVKPTETFLDTLGVFTLNGVDIRKHVVLLVKYHLLPRQFYKNYLGGVNMDSAIRRLATKGVSLKSLAILSAADSLGRGKDSLEYGIDAEEWFIDKIMELGVDEKPIPNLITGDDVLSLGVSPGPLVGSVLKHVYDLLLEGKLQTYEEAMEEARKFLRS